MTMTATTEKKQPKTPKAPKPEKQPKTVRVDFLTVAPSTILSTEGTLLTADVSAHGYDPKVHEHLGRQDFADNVNYMLFKARELRGHGQKLIERADRMEREATTAGSLGDPKQRAQVKKVARLQSALAELVASLKKDGIDVDSLMQAPQA